MGRRDVNFSQVVLAGSISMLHMNPSRMLRKPLGPFWGEDRDISVPTQILALELLDNPGPLFVPTCDDKMVFHSLHSGEPSSNQGYELGFNIKISELIDKP